MKRMGFTYIEFLAVILIMAIVVLLGIAGYTQGRTSALRTSCFNSMKLLGVAFKIYSQEAKGQKYPTMKYADGPECNRLVAGKFFFQGDQVYPKNLNDPVLTVCPAIPGAGEAVVQRYNCTRGGASTLCPCDLDGDSYFYTGFLVSAEHYVQSGADPAAPYGESLYLPFVDVLRALIDRQRHASTKHEAFAIVDSDVAGMQIQPPTPPNLYRLREGIERFTITEVMNPAASAVAQSRIPVLWDTFNGDREQFRHGQQGGNVLFLDGHVEFQQHEQAKHPFNPTWAHLVRMLE